MGFRRLPNGKTIGLGVGLKPEDMPDFIGAKYGGGKVGYVRKTDAFPEHSQRRRRWRRPKPTPGPRTIPVFDEDGETVIGEKVIGTLVEHPPDNEPL